MKKTIRLGVWETNSSSVHSFCICTEEEYDKWEKGDLYYNRDEEKLTPESTNNWGENNYSFGAFWEDIDQRFDSYEQYFETPSGDKMVVFGYYGYD